INGGGIVAKNGEACEEKGQVFHRRRHSNHGVFFVSPKSGSRPSTPTLHTGAPSGSAPMSGAFLSAARSGSGHSAGTGTPAFTAGLPGCSRRSDAFEASVERLTNLGSATRSWVVQPGS